MKSYKASVLFVVFLGVLSLGACAQTESRATIAWRWVRERKALLIDVRTPQEFAEGHLSGAINVPLDTIAENIQKIVPQKDQPIVLYCRSGNRSGQALSILKTLGYTNLHNGGGYQELAAVKPSNR
ncbi:MAG: rhodanese-like domain-containing protein [Breznakiellaceae bacterium]